MTRARSAWVLAVLCTGVGLVMAAITSLYAAGPEIAKAIGASQTELTWITDSYTLVMAGMLIPAGALGDRYGRKEILVLGCIIFVEAAIFLQFADTPTTLIAGRAVLGLGAAMILPSTLSLITSTFPADFRDTAVNIWTATFSIIGALGVLVTGLLLEFFPWQSSSWLILVGGVVVLLGSLTVPTSRADPPPALDIPGTLMAMVTITAFVYGLIEAGLRGWTDPLILGAFLVGFLAAGAFVLIQLRSPHAVLDVRLFKIRAFAVSAFVVTVCFASVYGLFFMVMQYEQFVAGHSSLVGAVPMTSLAVTTIPLTLAATWLTRRLGLRVVTAAGCALVAVSYLAFSTLTVDSPWWMVYVPCLTIGAAMGLAMAPSTAAIINNVSEAKQGVAASVNHTTREVGTALGVALVGGLLSASYSDDMAAATKGLPEPARGASQESVAGALGVAEQSGAQGGGLADAAQHAFVTATSDTALVMAGVMLVAAFITALWAPPKPAAAWHRFVPRRVESLRRAVVR